MHNHYKETEQGWGWNGASTTNSTGECLRQYLSNVNKSPINFPNHLNAAGLKSSHYPGVAAEQQRSDQQFPHQIPLLPDSLLGTTGIWAEYLGNVERWRAQPGKL